MTDQRFALADHLLETKPWQLFAMVEMGHRPDAPRLLEVHGPRAPQARAGQPVRERDPRLPRPRRRADRAACSSTPTTTRSCSSSPTTARSGWTAASASTSGCGARGCSRSSASPTASRRRSDVGIDWSRTTAWGDGGYYARVFLNVEGREPEGTVAAGRLRARPRRPRRAARGDPRRARATRSRRRSTSPRSSTTRSNGVAPDLIVDLRRPALALGRHGRRRRGHPHVRERHRPGRREPRAGRAAASPPAPGVGARGTLDAHLLDIAPTVLELLGMPVPEDMRGQRSRGDRAGRMNLVVYVSDALRTDHVGCYGARHVKTRTIDELAAAASASTRRSAAAPWTCPSTTSMITGLYPHHHGYLHWDATLDPAIPTLFSVAAAHGYDDRQLRLRRALPLQRLPRRERRRDERDARRRGRLARASIATSRSVLWFHSWATHMPYDVAPRRAEGVAAAKSEIMSGIQSDSASALEALREAYRDARSSVVGGASLAVVPRASSTRSVSASETVARLHLRPRRVVGRALRRQAGACRAPTTCTARRSSTRSWRCR